MCEEDLQALLAELADDVDFQKKRAISLALSAASTSPRPISFFERLIESIKKTKTLGELEDVLRKYARSRDLRRMAIIPLKFIAHNVEVVENVEFIHYTDEESGDSINREGFRGRETPHRQTLTREIHDTRVLDGGYIFAYPWESRLIDTVVDSVHGVWGEASQALAFNFEPDGGERQLIVPVKCITDYEYTYRPNPMSEVVAARGYLLNPHALDEDGQFEWYHRSSDDDLEFERMEDSQSKFPAFYLSSTASSVIDLGGSYNDTVYVINIKEGKYLDIVNIPEDELAEIQSCLVNTLEGRGIPRQDAIYLADYQLKMFKKSEMWYWMESVPVPSADVEMTVDYVSVISTIEGTKVKVPGSRRTYIFYRGYPNWNYPAVFIDCLKSLGYDGWFETQDNTVLPQITVALLNPMETAERNFEYPLYYAESLVERGQLP